METHEQKASVRDTFLRTVAVLGLIAVLLLGAWGIIQFAVSLPSLFGTIGGNVASLVTPGAQTESLTVSTPTTTTTGQSLTVSWTHQNGSGDYAYTISYACQSGLSIKAPLPNGSYQTVACNTPFNFVNASAHMILIPTLSGVQSAPLVLTLTATKLSTGAISATGSSTTRVTLTNVPVASNTASNNPAPTKPATPATQPTTSYNNTPSTAYYPAATRPLTYYGLPDLAVRVISVLPQGNNLVAVQFSVENDGTNIATGGWTFNAQLPIDGGYTFTSQPQRALYPGDKIVYTLAYQNTYQQYSPYGYNSYGYSYTNQGNYTCSGYLPCVPPTQYNYGYSNNYYGNNYNYGYQNGSVTITIDPYNQIPELSKANNVVTVPVSMY